jgi:hypothetical protein
LTGIRASCSPGSVYDAFAPKGDAQAVTGAENCSTNNCAKQLLEQSSFGTGLSGSDKEYGSNNHHTDGSHSADTAPPGIILAVALAGKIHRLLSKLFIHGKLSYLRLKIVAASKIAATKIAKYTTLILVSLQSTPKQE